MEKPHLSLAELEAFDPHAPQTAGRRRLCCPLCGGDKPRDAAHRCISLEVATGLWKCFRCGEGGKLREHWENESPFRFTGRESRTRHLKAAFAIAPEVPVVVPSSVEAGDVVEAAESTSPIAETPAAAPSARQWRDLWEAARELAPDNAGGRYLHEKRAVSLEVAHLSGVRFAPSWPRGPAVVFPISNRAGEVVAAQGRGVLGSAKLTYGPKKEGVFQAPVMLPTGRVLRPFDAEFEAIIITEAPIDALSLATCGFPAIALCGTSGPSWLHLACGLRRVWLAFDADEAGERAADQLAAQLKPFGARCQRIAPSGAKDWNELLLSAGREELSDAVWLYYHALS